MSTIYEINPDGSASVAEPKSKRAGAAMCKRIACGTRLTRYTRGVTLLSCDEKP